MNKTRKTCIIFRGILVRDAASLLYDGPVRQWVSFLKLDRYVRSWPDCSATAACGRVHVSAIQAELRLIQRRVRLGPV